MFAKIVLRGVRVVFDFLLKDKKGIVQQMRMTLPGGPEPEVFAFVDLEKQLWLKRSRLGLRSWASCTISRINLASLKNQVDQEHRMYVHGSLPCPELGFCETEIMAGFL